MKPSLLYLRLLLLLYIFTVCSTSRINISVLQPAEVLIPLSIQKVSLFPGAGIPNPPGIFDNELSNSPNRNQAYRAAINLAVTWERDDDLVQAREWARYADSLSANDKTKTYIKILDQRIQFKAELDYQMTGK